MLFLDSNLPSGKQKIISIHDRIVLAPMTRGRAGVERIPNELMAEYYFQRASAGLIITEAAWRINIVFSKK